MLVFALLVMVTAALVIGGLAQLAATQSLVGGREWEEAQQRVVLGNSRAMARQFVLSSVFSNRVNGPMINPLSVTFSNAGLGAFRLTNIVTEPTNNFDFWSAYLTTNPVTGLNINPFNILERGGFYPAMIQAELSDGSTNTNGVRWNLQVRTRNPIAAGYSLIWHRPAAIDNPGVSNRLVFPSTDNPASVRVGVFTSLPAVPLISVTNLSASYSDGGFYLFDVPTRDLTNSFPSSNIIFTTNGNGTEATAKLVLSNISSPLTQPLMFDVPATTPSGNVPVTTLRIVGEPDALKSDPAVLVRCAQSNDNLSRVELEDGANERRLYVIIDRVTAPLGNSEFSLSWPALARWRLGLSLSLRGGYANRLSLDDDPATLVGGLRTDAEGLASTPNIEFQPETNPGSLDFIADQMMWLEDYRAP